MHVSMYGKERFTSSQLCYTVPDLRMQIVNTYAQSHGYATWDSRLPVESDDSAKCKHYFLNCGYLHFWRFYLEIFLSCIRMITSTDWVQCKMQVVTDDVHIQVQKCSPWTALSRLLNCPCYTYTSQVCRCILYNRQKEVLYQKIDVKATEFWLLLGFIVLVPFSQYWLCC